MKLKTLIKHLPIKRIQGDDVCEISGIHSDSRQISKGMLFVAVSGTTVDGHDYIGKAIEKGAGAIVCEKIPEQLGTCDVPFVVVPDTAQALGMLLDTWYDHPSSKLTLIGVTGTNGKTTVATLLYHLFGRLGYKCGLISTVCNYIGQEAIPTTHTTPDAVTLHALVAQMAKAGCTYVFMEVSSHAIDQQRISGLTYRGGVFTNLSRDHLDYHKTVEHYLEAKKKFFDDLPAAAFALTNADEKSGMVMLQNTAATKRTYSLQTVADFKGKILETHFEGTELLINDREVAVHFVGRFNASNLLAVYGTLGQDPEAVLVVLSDLRPVTGRFETIPSLLGYTAIVDYAHTPDALTNVLNSIHDVLRGNGRVITVVGAGGNRDKGKRPLMAKEAAKHSDQLILTSDNPRFEDPDAIIEEMLAGLSPVDSEHTLCITDRKQAIKTAVCLAKKGDVILVAGKGHEDYQEINGIKHHFDDREILRTIFATQHL